jgi:hypothetical protein
MRATPRASDRDTTETKGDDDKRSMIKERGDVVVYVYAFQIIQCHFQICRIDFSYIMIASAYISEGTVWCIDCTYRDPRETIDR